MWWYDGMEGTRLLIAPEALWEKDTTENISRQVIQEKQVLGPLVLKFSHVLRKDAMPVGSEGRILSLRHPKSDGSLYIATPVDPIFILLPIFEVARMMKGNEPGMFRQLEEILYIDDYPGYQHLMSMAKNCMHLVCDMKEIGLSKFYRLDNSKVLAWLCHKVHHLEKALEKLDKNHAAQAERDRLKDAVSLLGEYLVEDPWLTLLCSRLELNIHDISSKACKNELVPTSMDNTPTTSHAIQGKTRSGKSISSIVTRSKKLKIETDSKNIKDMFCKASKRESK